MGSIVHPWLPSWQPASIDWCEPNYIVSPLIAEFWNTISSLAFCVTATYAAWWKYRQGLEMRFILVEVAVWIVGMGSAMFHATLTFWGQLADELPMLYGAFLWAYVILHQTRKRGVIDWAVVLGLSVLAVSWTLISRFVHLHLNWVFEVVFGIIILACMWLLFRMTVKSKSVWALPLFKFYVALSLLSFVLWNLDQYFCARLKAGIYVMVPWASSLHGYWHLGMSIAMYAATLLVAMLRFEHLNARPASIRWGILPTFDAGKSK